MRAIVFLSLGVVATFCTACVTLMVKEEIVVPLKHANVSEEKALRALDDYLEAVSSLANLYDSSECHARCFYLGLSGVPFSNRQERLERKAVIKEDMACAKALKRYKKSHSKAFGTEDSTWKGPIFGYVWHYQDGSETWIQDKRERDEEIGKRFVSAFTSLLEEQPLNPIIPMATRDLACVYDYQHTTWGEDTYKDWLTTTNPTVEPAMLSPSWRAAQYRSLLRGCLVPSEKYDQIPEYYVQCTDFEAAVEGSEEDIRTVGECSFPITGDNYLLMVIRKYCDLGQK